MKKALLYGLMGIGLAILPCYGAICSQTDWLTEPVLAADNIMEPIPFVEPMDDVEADCPEPHRPTEEELLQAWWEFDRPNDPDIPDELEEAVYIYSDMFNICPEFMEAIFDKETGGTFKEDVKDKSGKCWGVAQINIKAQAKRIKDYGLTPEDMLTYDGAVLVATSYVAELFDEYEDPAIVLMKYNGATTALQNYTKTGKLNYYTRYILKRSQELEEKHRGMTEG